MRLSHAEKQAAMIIYDRLRRNGAPTLVTGDEAWRLSSGLIGRKGDHGTPLALTKVAIALAESGVEK